MQAFSAGSKASPSGSDLEVTPSQFLKFTAPFDRSLDQEFQVANKSTRNRYCFKIKSNAPKNRLIVSPKMGIVEPGQSIQHRVVLNPQQRLRPFNPPPSYGILIQAVLVGPGVANVESIWSHPQEPVQTMKLECVYLGEGGDELLRPKPPKKVTLPGKVLDTPASGLNQAFVDPVSLTVTAPTGGMGGSLKKSVFDLQPVMQPPNTATVVFPSLGAGNLGELEIVDNRPTGDGNNNNKKNDSWDDWNTPAAAGDGQKPAAAPAANAATSGWDDDWGTANVAAGGGGGDVGGGSQQTAQTNDDGWGQDPPPPPPPAQQAAAAANDGGWNDNAAATNWNQNGQTNNWNGVQQQQMHAAGGDNYWGEDQPLQQPLVDYPAPPIAGIDDQVRTLLAVALAAIAVFLFGMLLGKAGL